MPFKETCSVEERIALFREYNTQAFSVSDLCRRYGISRDVLRVAAAPGERQRAVVRGLSHAAASCPHATPEGIAERIIAVQRQFPHFGLKKIKAWLAEKEPAMVWPARRNRR